MSPDSKGRFCALPFPYVSYFDTLLSYLSYRPLESGTETTRPSGGVSGGFGVLSRFLLSYFNTKALYSHYSTLTTPPEGRERDYHS